MKTLDTDIRGAHERVKLPLFIVSELILNHCGTEETEQVMTLQLNVMLSCSLSADEVYSS